MIRSERYKYLFHYKWSLRWRMNKIGQRSLLFSTDDVKRSISYYYISFLPLYVPEIHGLNTCSTIHVFPVQEQFRMIQFLKRTKPNFSRFEWTKMISLRMNSSSEVNSPYPDFILQRFFTFHLVSQLDQSLLKQSLQPNKRILKYSTHYFKLYPLLWL